VPSGVIDGAGSLPGERGGVARKSGGVIGGAGSLPGERGGMADEELGAAAGYEDAGIHCYPQAAELRPAEDVLQGLAGGSPVHHGGEVGRRTCRRDE